MMYKFSQVEGNISYYRDQTIAADQQIRAITSQISLLHTDNKDTRKILDEHGDVLNRLATTVYGDLRLNVVLACC